MPTQISLEEWLQQLDNFDQTVEQVSDISTICTGSDWQLAAYHTLHETRTPSIWRDGDCWFLGCVGPLNPFRQTLQPFEMSWAFGTPLLGPTTEESVDFLLDLLNEQEHKWQLVMLSGIPRNSFLQEHLIHQLSSHYHIDLFEGAHCMQSLLHDGLDHFLSKRSSKFRANLRRSGRKARDRGIQFEWLNDGIDPKEILQRALDIEARSWKFASGNSIFQTKRFQHFYQHIADTMSQNGRLRALFATHEGQDVAYVLGAVMGRVYRGFQLSYDDAYASLSLGNLAQWEMLQKLVEHDNIHTYDLGMMMDYKEKWSDKRLELDNLVIFLDR